MQEDSRRLRISDTQWFYFLPRILISNHIIDLWEVYWNLYLPSQEISCCLRKTWALFQQHFPFLLIRLASRLTKSLFFITGRVVHCLCIFSSSLTHFLFSPQMIKYRFFFLLSLQGELIMSWQIFSVSNTFSVFSFFSLQGELSTAFAFFFFFFLSDTFSIFSSNDKPS